MTVPRPRRFNYVFEFADSQGGEVLGTRRQRELVRHQLRSRAPFNSPYDRALHALALDVSASGSHYVQIRFDPIHEEGLLGRAFPLLIQLTTLFGGDTKPAKYWEHVLHHEVGHVFGWRILNPVDRSERWANRFSWWVRKDQALDDEVWERLGV